MDLRLSWNWLKFIPLFPQWMQKFRELYEEDQDWFQEVEWGGSKVFWWHIWLGKMSNCGGQMEDRTIGTQIMVSATWIKIDFQHQYACFQFLKGQGNLLRFDEKNLFGKMTKKFPEIFLSLFFISYFVGKEVFLKFCLKVSKSLSQISPKFKL